jgi:hypothetical protein
VSASPQELTDEYPRYEGADNQSLRLEEQEGRQVYWWSLFFDAAAPAYKDEIENYFQNYQQDIDNLATFILSDYPKITDPEELKRINENSQKRFQNLRAIATTGAQAQKRSPHGILRNLLYKETGPSAYKMITTLKAVQKYRQQKGQKAVLAAETTPEPLSIQVA